MVLLCSGAVGTLLELMLGGDYRCQPEPHVSGAEVSKYSDCNV